MSLLKYMFCVVYRRLFEPSVNKKNVRDSRLEMLIASIYIYETFLAGRRYFEQPCMEGEPSKNKTFKRVEY